MSYRKLNFEGKTYEYVIGSKFTKVKLDGKEFAVYENRLYGNEVVYPRSYEEDKITHSGNFIVTPKTVTRMLRGFPPETFNTKDGKTSYLMVNPFSAEIYETIDYIPYNRENYYNLADEI